MIQAFKDFNLQDFLLAGLDKMGISTPTPVQMQIIPAVLAGKDVIGRSQTGTGKTLAYVLPLLQRIDKERHELQALILAPTRELIHQISGIVEQFAGDRGIDTLVIQGGIDIDRQVQRLKRNPQVIVGTPGRVWDLIDQEKLLSHTVRCLVIDEADTMLEMGFKGEIEKILQRVKKDTQVLFFAATLPQKAALLAKSVMNQPLYVNINPAERALSSIENVFFRVRSESKTAELIKLVKLYNPYLGIVFIKKKEQVDEVVTELRNAGFAAEGLHGDMQKGQRKQAMQRFREAKSQILVATDIASRGLDIEGVTHIFNFDPPINLDQYIHRIGRTGRAGETGTAVNLVNAAEEEKLKFIAEKLGRTFREKMILKDEIIDRAVKKKNIGKTEKAGKAVTAKPKKYTGPNAKKKAAKEAQEKRERALKGQKRG